MQPAALPRRAAEALRAHVLGGDRASVLAGRALSADQERHYEALCLRRAAREPLEYLLGEVDFAGIRLLCDRRALIPRPETEDLVAMAGSRLKGLPSPRVADIGTGTGAIALALKALFPAARIIATDASEGALALARENAARLGLDVAFRLGRDLEPLEGMRFDAILANPPYVTEAEFPSLQPEVRDWEPREALVSGPEGTEVHARWAPAAARLLAPGGFLLMETGFGQAERVSALFHSAGLARIIVTPDFAGIPRFVSGERA